LQAYATIDDWVGKTMGDIRAMEAEVRRACQRVGAHHAFRVSSPPHPQVARRSVEAMERMRKLGDIPPCEGAGEPASRAETPRVPPTPHPPPMYCRAQGTTSPGAAR
jgi:alkanesulfonate monooxygenase SsuD/methylene tetrahydromethanopterin reductase-like flavin-dependent oxidoreductase (luciferase family)